MNIRKLLFGFLLAATSAGTLACEYPNFAQIPADESVRESRRTLIQLEMIRYIKTMSSYVECLQADYETASAEDASSFRLSVLADRNNHAIAEIVAMQRIYGAWIGPIDELAALEKEECIDAGRGIRDIVLDNQTILFYTRRDDIFLNVLESSCPILWANNSSLRYSLTKRARFVEEICSGSPVLDSTTPAGVRRCLLGPFYPISESEAAQLRSLTSD